MSNFKKIVRQRMKKTGESYQVAARQVRKKAPVIHSVSNANISPQDTPETTTLNSPRDSLKAAVLALQPAVESAMMTAEAAGRNLQPAVESAMMTAEAVGRNLQPAVESAMMTAEAVGRNLQPAVESAMIMAEAAGRAFQPVAEIARALQESPVALSAVRNAAEIARLWQESPAVAEIARPWTAAAEVARSCQESQLVQSMQVPSGMESSIAAARHALTESQDIERPFFHDYFVREPVVDVGAMERAAASEKQRELELRVATLEAEVAAAQSSARTDDDDDLLN